MTLKVCSEKTKLTHVCETKVMNIPLAGDVCYVASQTDVLQTQPIHNLILYDNLSNIKLEAIDQLEIIYGERALFIMGDIRGWSLGKPRGY